MYNTTKKEMTTTEFQTKLINVLDCIDDTLQTNHNATTDTMTGYSLIDTQFMLAEKLDKLTEAVNRIANALEGSK